MSKIANILVIPTKEYTNNFDNYSNNIFKLVKGKSYFRPRPDAEKDPTTLQLIPYIVLINDSNQIFTYTRLNKGNEARLHNKMSIGIGGHIDQSEDTIGLAAKDIIVMSAYKELFEEMDIGLTDKFLDIFFTDKLIYDPSNDVGAVHLGLLYTCDVTGREVSVAEKDKIEGKFMTHDELRNLYSSNQDCFETWTTIALKQLGVIQ